MFTKYSIKISRPPLYRKLTLSSDFLSFSFSVGWKLINSCTQLYVRMADSTLPQCIRSKRNLQPAENGADWLDSLRKLFDFSFLSSDDSDCPMHLSSLLIDHIDMSEKILQVVTCRMACANFHLRYEMKTKTFNLSPDKMPFLFFALRHKFCHFRLGNIHGFLFK
jgi:hypothetical protein